MGFIRRLICVIILVQALEIGPLGLSKIVCVRTTKGAHTIGFVESTSVAVCCQLSSIVHEMRFGYAVCA
jgi:hypothetical protein